MEIATELITTAAIVLIVHLFLRGFFPKKEIPFWLWCIGYYPMVRVCSFLGDPSILY